MDFLLTRTDDFAVLGARLVGFDVDGDTAVAGAAGARVTLVAPPQHIDEQTVSAAPGEDAAVAAALSGTSRMTFAVAAGAVVPLTAEGVLTACTDVLVDGSAQTSIELPARLAFEPLGARATVPASALTSPGGVTGLWLTRFAAAGATGATGATAMTLHPVDRDLAGAADVAFPTPLSAQQRLSIVDHSAGTPGMITRLEVTSLGGSLTANGEWPDLSWSHRTTLGRDQFVRTEQRVLLYPFGFQGVLTTVTERDPDLNAVLPGEPAALYQRVTLRLTSTVLASSDGSALRRTFPFGRVEVLASVFGALGDPVTDYTHTRATPDVAALQDQLATTNADSDQAYSVWAPYVDGQHRTYDDLLHRSDGTALAYQAADAEYEPWAAALASIQDADAAAQPYYDAIQNDEGQIAAIQANPQGDDGGLSPDQSAQVNELFQDEQGNRQEAQQYYVDPGYRQQIYANYNGKKPNVDALWAQVQNICNSQPRDISDALDLGDDTVAPAAQRYQDDQAAIADLTVRIDAATQFDPDTEVTAWPTTADGNRLLFPVRMSRGSEVVDAAMPMMIIYDKQLPAIPEWDLPEYDTLSDPELPGKLDLAWAGPADAPPATFDATTAPASVVDFGGALFDVVGAAAPLPSDKQVIKSVNIVAARADQLFEPSLGRVASDGAKRWGLAVDLPALQQLAGPGVPGVDTSAFVGFAADYVEHGEQAAALFETVTHLGVDFTKAADHSGGLAALQLLPDGISREHGPAQLASLLASPNPVALIGESAGLLGFKLQDLIAAIPNLKPPIIVSDLTDAHTPVVKLTWEHVALHNLLAFKTNGKPPDNPARTELNLHVVSQVDGTVADCVVNDFRLQFPFDDADALIRLSFASLSFHQQTTYGVDVTPGVGLGADPSVSVTAAGHVSTGTPKITVDGFGLEFLGALELLKTLQDVVDLGGKQPGIAPSPRGVTASFDLPVPDVGCGAFALSNITFHSRVDVPFDGSPISVDVGFATRDKPFSLSVLAFSGGGYIDVSIDAAGPRVDASLEFGARLDVDFFVARGEVHALGGVQYLQQGDDVSISGYLRIGGSLEILSLVSVSVELRIALTYANRELVGRATLVLEIDLTFWSDTVEIDSGLWVLSGGGPSTTTQGVGQQETPLLEDEAEALAAVDAPVSDAELLAWQAYRASFAGSGASA